MHKSKYFFLSYQLYGLKNPIISPSKMTDDQNSQKTLADCTHNLSILNLTLTRRIYSMVDVFTVSCMRNNAII